MFEYPISDDHTTKPERYCNFLLFEPSSLRLREQDILVRGNDVRPFFNEVLLL